jgi:hypothetical protein
LRVYGVQARRHRLIGNLELQGVPTSLTSDIDDGPDKACGCSWRERPRGDGCAIEQEIHSADRRISERSDVALELSTGNRQNIASTIWHFGSVIVTPTPASAARKCCCSEQDCCNERMLCRRTNFHDPLPINLTCLLRLLAGACDCDPSERPEAVAFCGHLTQLNSNCCTPSIRIPVCLTNWATRPYFLQSLDPTSVAACRVGRPVVCT